MSTRALKGAARPFYEARFGRDIIMQHRNKLNSLSVPATSTSVADAKVATLLRDYKYAKAEITRLKLALAQARDELEALSDATSEFVHFML